APHAGGPWSGLSSRPPPGVSGCARGCRPTRPYPVGARRPGAARSVVVTMYAPPGGEDLHLRPGEDEPLAPVKDLPYVGRVGGDDRDADLGPSVQVRQADLGGSDLEPAQCGDDRPHVRPLG